MESNRDVGPHVRTFSYPKTILLFSVSFLHTSVSSQSQQSLLTA